MIRKFYRIRKFVQNMNKSVGISVVIGIVIVIGIIGYQINETTYHVSTPDEYKEAMGTESVAHVVYPENPQLLGPLQINKDKYLLGENVFMIIRDLQPGDKGTVLIITPENKIYDKWGFNGSERDYQKKYFKPQLLLSKNICQKEQLVGMWTVMFEGYDMAKLHFEVIPDILPNEDSYFEECGISYEINLEKP